MKFSKLALLLIIFTIVSCEFCDELFPEPDPLPELNFETQIDSVLIVQENYGNLFIDLITTIDTQSAKEQLIPMIQSEPSVKTAISSPQGISIEYRDGIRGFLLLNPRSDDKDGFSPQIVEDRNDPILPTSSGAVQIDPRFTDIDKWGTQIYDNLKTQLLNVGYGPPTRITYDAANIDFFKNLNGYGIIQLYSHGILWNGDLVVQNYPNYKDTVYLATGEHISLGNVATALAHQPDIQSKDMCIISDLATSTSLGYYGISPDFISKYNSFTADSTFILGGFCYSGIGQWPSKMISAGALGYLGFDWWVYAEDDRNWTNDLITKLCDTSLLEPYTVGNWLDEKARTHDNNPPPPADPSNQKTDVVYSGEKNLALWKNEPAQKFHRADVSFHLYDADLIETYADTTPTIYLNGIHHSFSFSSVNGTMQQNGNTYHTTFNKTVSGSTYSGTMDVTIINDSVIVVANVTNVYGTLVDKSTLRYAGSTSISNVSFLKQMWYHDAGISLVDKCSNITYSYRGPNSTRTLTNYTAHPSDFITVAMYYD